MDVLVGVVEPIERCGSARRTCENRVGERTRVVERAPMVQRRQRQRTRGAFDQTIRTAEAHAVATFMRAIACRAADIAHETCLMAANRTGNDPATLGLAELAATNVPASDVVIAARDEIHDPTDGRVAIQR